MFVFSNFLMALARVLDILLNLYMWVIIIRALISWVNPDPFNPIVRFLRNVTDPFLNWIRRTLRLGYFGGIDISPLIAILIIYFLRYFVVSTLVELAVKMR